MAKTRVANTSVANTRVANKGTATLTRVAPPAGSGNAFGPQGSERILERAREREREGKAADGDQDKGHPHDQPGEAAQFELKKRLPVGQSILPVERYLAARDSNNLMPRYSSTVATQVPSTQASGPGDIANVNTILSNWTSLGPGNIGGRVRSLLINPTTPSIMYAAGVAGGVWKSTTSGASWSPLGDFLSNIAVNDMAMDPSNPNVIYAGTGEGYWNIDGMRGAGIFKTTDGGATWTALANTTRTPDFYYVNKLVVSPVNGNRVYAGTRTGIWRSTDAGVTWSRVLDSSSNSGCFDLAMRTDQSTDYIFASCGTFAQARIYRNTDAGGAGAWTSVYTETRMGLTSLAIAPSNQSIIYALSASLESGNFQDGLLGVFRSTSNGDPGSWTAQVRNTSTTKLNTLLLSNPVIASATNCGSTGDQYFNQGWYDNIIAVDPVNPNVVWAGGIDLFRSDDGGANWGLASYWWAGTTVAGYSHADQHAIVFHPQYDGNTNKTMFVGNDGGLFTTANARAAVATSAAATCNYTNTSTAWSNLNNGIGITQFYDGAVTPDGATYFGGTQDNGTNLGTSSAGPNGWRSILGGDGGYVAVDPTNSSVMYAEYTGLSLQKSTNAGAGWSNATAGISGDNGFLFIAPFAMDPNSSTKLWTGGSSLWRTTNGAGSWIQASVPTSDNSSITAITVAPGNSNIAAAGTSGGRVLVNASALSATSGSTWLSTQPRNGYVSWVAFDPANTSVLYATYASFNVASADAHVYRSADRGTTWTAIGGTGSGTLPDIPVHCLAVDPSSPGRLYIGTDLGVYTTIDYGVTWNLEVTSFANVTTQRLLINTVAGNNTLFAFTHGRGVWKAPITSASGCNFTLSADQAFSTAGGTGTVTVTTQTGCAWTTGNNNTWITVTGSGSGTGNGSVAFTVSANTGAARTGTLSIGSATVRANFTVTQAGANAGGNDEISGAVLVPALQYNGAQDTTTATSNTTDPVHSCTTLQDGKTVWYRYVATFTGVVSVNTLGSTYDTVLSVYPGTTSAGAELACNDDSSGTLQSQLTFNATNGQSYLIEVSGYGLSGGGALALVVAQFSTCSTSISPTAQSFGSGGGSGTINVTANSCAWSSLSNVGWATITTGSTGTGTGTVNYSVATNTGGSSRSGTITVGAQAFTVTQTASCGYALSASGQSLPAGGGSASVTVTTSTGCAWNAVNTDSWVHVSTTLPVTGSGTLAYTVDANTATGARTSNFTVAGLTYSMTEAGTSGTSLNDEIAAATSIFSLPGSTTESTSAATSNATDPVPSCTFSTNTRNSSSVWFSYVANYTGVLRVDTFGSNYDTVLTAYPGSTSIGSELACSDDSNSTLQSQIVFPVSSGQSYLIEVAGYSNLGGGSLVLNASSIANDDINGATQILSLPSQTTQITTSATSSSSDPVHTCTGTAGSKTVWFRYVASFTGALNVNTYGSDYDTMLSAYSATATSASELACNDDSLSSLQSQISFNVASGQSYLIEVSTFGSGAGGTLSLNAVQITNDEAAGATAISSEPYSVTQNIQTATANASDPAHTCTSGQTNYHTLWYRYTADFTGAIRFDTLGSDYDTVLSVYAAASPQTEIACNDDDPVSGTIQSRISFSVTAGQAYLVEVSSYYATDTGSVILNVNSGSTTRAVLLAPPPGSTLPGPSATFTWNADSGASAYWLDVGTAQGQGNLFGQNVGTVTSRAVTGIPTSGATIYVRLWTLLGSTWQYNDYTYTASGSATRASMSTPAPGSTLTGAAVTFSWNAGAGASAYWLDVGTGLGQGNLFGQNVGVVTNRAVTGIPTNGTGIYVRLWTLLGSTWQYNDYTYIAAAGATRASISTPAPGSTLSGAAATFTWNAGSGASAYWLDVGTGLGQGNLFGQNVGVVTSRAVTGIPTSGITIYVRLWTLIGSTWQYNDYTYTASGGAIRATMSTPVPGSTLGGAAVTFTWNAGAGAAGYWLDAGTGVGQGNLFGQNVGSVTTQTVNGMPTNGIKIYVRLWTLLGGAWQYNDYTYTAAGVGGGSGGGITTPVPGSVLPGSSATFNWTAAAGADQYWLDVGSAPGTGDYFGGSTSGTSVGVSPLPCDARTVYVQFWSHLGGSWQTPVRYAYTAASGCAALASPGNSAVFPGTTVTFTWNVISGADQYWLDVGNLSGAGDIFAGSTTGTTVTVNNMPCDGRSLYAQLRTHSGSVWQNPGRYSFTAWGGCGRLTIPSPGSTLSGGTVTFNWNAGAGVSAYWLDVGTAPGSGNIFGGNVGTTLSKTVSAIPVNGSAIYVQLWSQIGGVWYPNRSGYTAFH